MQAIERGMRMEEIVMKIWGPGKGFTGFAHLMTHPLSEDL